ncbi:hypothetical protein G8O30_08035 [Mangrovibacillus cuniculi]|uniref:Uncharacterized protein n=2 Tax=Mangrovibacillus cuniculi TaxID=2593652 RepID=A0A7S8CEB8_9BACI|nr:hypothetical protein G8O30_08035 [Mangrovibacillus cuniculi]
MNGRRNGDDVAGARDNQRDFKVKVNAYIDGDDFCRAVNRCLGDLVAGANDDDNHNGRRRRHCWEKF